VYNLSSSRSVKRRIPLEGVAGVTNSTESDEFVLHVPSEYDYRLSTARKADVIAALQSAAAGAGLPAFEVSPSPLPLLKDVVLTRVQAGLRRTSSASGPILVPMSPRSAAACAATATCAC
jgi:hypothetical protein